MDKIREGIWGNEQSTTTYMENYHKKPTVLFAKKNKSIRSHVMAHTHSLSTKVAKAERRIQRQPGLSHSEPALAK